MTQRTVNNYPLTLLRDKSKTAANIVLMQKLGRFGNLKFYTYIYSTVIYF